jgi:hypothetical protein
MAFKITGLSPEPFHHLYGLDDQSLAARGALRIRATDGSALPDRVELRDAEPGETLLLVNYLHQPADTPYRSSHAIFVLEGAVSPAVFEDELPDVLAKRPLSLRAFGPDHMMVDAELVEGREARPLIERMLGAAGTAYIQAHYARRGCYAARIEPS